jgi:hypothetical protein
LDTMDQSQEKQFTEPFIEPTPLQICGLISLF